jgi:WD40 repeat protein
LWRASGRHQIAVFNGHTGIVDRLVFSPDGRRLASRSAPVNRLVSPSSDGTVRIWNTDPQANQPILQGHTSYVYPVAHSPDGRWIASGSWDKTIRIWDARTRTLSVRLDHESNVRALAFSPDSSWLVSGCDSDDQLQIWEVATGQHRKTIRGPGKSLGAVAVSPDGGRIAAVNREGKLVVIDFHTGEEIASLGMKGSFVRKALAYSCDGRWLAGTGEENKIIVWDTATWRPAMHLEGHTSDIDSVAFSPDGRKLVSAGRDQTVRVWDISTKECLFIFKGHTDEVFTAIFHPSGTRIASAGRDRAIFLWDAATGEQVTRLQGHTNYVFSLAFSPDGRTLASGSGDGTVRLWDSEPLARHYQASCEGDPVRPDDEPRREGAR